MTDSEHIISAFDDIYKGFKKKQEEYKGASLDVFRNFNQGALLSGESPEEILLGYVNKQIVSLFDAKNTNKERLNNVAFINEKAGDIATYMIILMAMVRSKNATDINSTTSKPRFENITGNLTNCVTIRDVECAPIQ